MENCVELAKQGDIRAIAYLINRNLQPQGIAVSKVEIASGKLLIVLQAEAEIEDAIVQRVHAGAKKLNIPTVKQVDVLQEEKPKPTQPNAPVEPPKQPLPPKELHSLKDAWREIRYTKHQANPVLLGSFFVIALFVVFHPTPDESASPAQTASTPAVQPARGGCQTSAGNIWSGVNLYSDSGCSNLAGVIVGAKSDAQTIKVSADGGGEGWYSRDDVRRFYVKGDDPAIARMQLITEE
jgi:hypothetical protein